MSVLHVNLMDNTGLQIQIFTIDVIFSIHLWSHIKCIHLYCQGPLYLQHTCNAPKGPSVILLWDVHVGLCICHLSYLH